MKEFITIPIEDLSLLEENFLHMKKVVPEIAGAEIFCTSIKDRELPLYESEEEFEAQAALLKKGGVKRLHASYWASPAAFLYKLSEEELYEHFGGKDEVTAYYSDESGCHLYERWCQEYALAAAIGAEAYVFHLIDYFPIDGQWRFTVTREQILDCMVRMTADFVAHLEKSELLTVSSPVIELENAGWGLEYGVQTAEDFAYLFNKVNDSYDKLRISWDINHLLHAVGVRENKGCFFLPEHEINERMRRLQKDFGDDPDRFALEWVKSNLLHDVVKHKVHGVQLSDCVMKEHQYFTEGWMEMPWRENLEKAENWEEKENYGVDIVLTHYDSHVPLGKGILTGEGMAKILAELEMISTDCNLLHELKNSTDLIADVTWQRSELMGGER